MDPSCCDTTDSGTGVNQFCWNIRVVPSLIILNTKSYRILWTTIFNNQMLSNMIIRKICTN